ncbi:MAG: hypothetical protein Q8O53_01895 [Candidatus Moranbacteria bacterium]|nr:hypothetical protein [Candidatus Moranbacteria bacterium]
MQEKKRPEKTKALPELKASVTEVLVVSGRSFQPFIRTFSYVGENVTKSDLGTLLGVFEIDDQSEDSAYIVNFLASVAKKEYFNNPRRGAIESFEAALHKINLALAELVKHGNTTWLGKFHGTLGVLEKNNLHFSVTGQAKILLSRNDTIADISIGLASEESSLHPIKTFVEVSSGRLATTDQILLCSPELLALFSLEELTKYAVRMDHERFAQFLKTALVNELDMAGLMIVDVTENTTPITENKKAKEVAPARTANVFSQSAFLPKKPTEAPSVQETLADEQYTKAKEEEYIDTKTGHIYIQGETPAGESGHPQWEQFRLGFQNTLHTFGHLVASQKKWISRGRKHVVSGSLIVIEGIHNFTKGAARSLRRQWRKQRAVRAERKAEQACAAAKEAAQAAMAPVTPPVQVKNEQVIPVAEVTSITQEEPLTQTVVSGPSPTKIPELGEEMPLFLREKLALFYKRQEAVQLPTTETPMTPYHLAVPGGSLLRFCSAILQKCSAVMRTLWQWLYTIGENLWRFFSAVLSPSIKKSLTLFQNLSLHQKQIFLVSVSVVLSLVVLGGYFLSRNTTKQPTTATEAVTVISATPESQDTPESTLTTIIDTPPNTIVTSVILGGETYVITEKNILSVTDNESFPIPSNSPTQYATAMNDLRLIFIFTENGRLYAFSPISKTFVENTLALGEGVHITAIGTYLTYLYVLDSATDQIYRFPRADGGFGAGVSWFKDSTLIEDGAQMAVSETIFISPDSATIKGFFRGRASVTLEAPAGLHVTALYTYPGLTNVYALDRDNKRVLIWSQDGKLLNTLSNDKLSEAQTLSVNEKQNEVFVSTEHTLLSFKIK